MKLNFLLCLVIFLGLITLGESILSSRVKHHPRLKSRKTGSKFSCTCGPYVPLCDMIFSIVKQRFDVDITAKANTLNKGEYFTVDCPNYALSNMVARIESEGLKKLATAIGLNDVKITKSQLVLSTGTIYGATFNGQITYKSTTVDLQIAFVKSLHMTFWAGLKITYQAMLGTLGDAMGQGTTPKTLGTDAKNMLDKTLLGSSFTLIIQTGPIDFTNIKELEPSILAGANKDKITSEKAALILLGNIQIAQIEATLIGGWLKKCGVGQIDLLAKIQLDEFYAEASLDQVTLGSHVKLVNPGMYIKLKYSSPNALEIGIQSQLELTWGDNKKLTFDGAIVFTLVDAGFKFAMRDMWINAFGLSRLSFGRLQLQLKLAYAGAIPTQFMVGGELAIGVECYDENKNFIGTTWCLNVKAYVGLGATEPSNNFFYVESGTRLNLQTIVTSLFGSKESAGAKVPAILIQALEIQEGMVISFLASLTPVTLNFKVYDDNLPSEQQIPNTLTIPAGFNFKGTVTLLSVTASLELAVKKGAEGFTEFAATIDVKNPIAFGKVLILSHATVAERGPLFSLKYQSSISLEVSAKIEFFGFSVATSLFFDDTKLSFSFISSWKDWIPFSIQMSVEATYAKMAINTFHLKGSFQRNTEPTKWAQLFKNIGAALEGSLVDLVKRLGHTISGAIESGWNKAKSWWHSWFGFKDRNSYLATFFTNMIKTDRAKAKRIAAAYMKGITTMLDLKEVSFGIDYDDVAECGVSTKTLLLSVKIVGTVMDKEITLQGSIDIFSLERMAVSLITWALHAIEKLF